MHVLRYAALCEVGSRIGSIVTTDSLKSLTTLWTLGTVFTEIAMDGGVYE